MELVTNGAAVAGVGGGMGCTTAAMLAGMVLASDRAQGIHAVLVDVRADIAVMLGKPTDMAGITDLADHGGGLETVLRELSADAAALAEGRLPLPLLLPAGSRQGTSHDVAAAVSEVIERGWRPVVDCGSRDSALELFDAVVDPYVLSRIVVLDHTPAAAARAEPFGLAGVRLLREREVAELTVDAFCEHFPIDAVMPRMPEWDEWVNERVVPQRLVEAMAGNGDGPAAAALAGVAALLLQPI